MSTAARLCLSSLRSWCRLQPPWMWRAHRSSTWARPCSRSCSWEKGHPPRSSASPPSALRRACGSFLYSPLLTPNQLTMQSVMNTLVLPQCTGAGVGSAGPSDMAAARGRAGRAWRISWRRGCSTVSLLCGDRSGGWETARQSLGHLHTDLKILVWSPQHSTGFFPAVPASNHFPLLPFFWESRAPPHCPSGPWLF